MNRRRGGTEEDRRKMKSTNHMSYFSECRNDSLNHVANQTNNLIIRLDKLINRLGGDEDMSKREYERKVVPWSDDSEYPRCRVCNGRFSLTRRRHHCRLCGKIMCNSCSLYLSFNSARKLTGPEFTRPSDGSAILLGGGTGGVVEEDGSASGNSSATDGGKLEGGGLAMMALVRSDSLQFMKNKLGSMLPSFTSVDNSKADDPEEQNLRICDVCKRLLDRREEAMDLRTSHSVFVDVYQKLCQLLAQIANLAPSYRNMAESLNNGESIYSVESANELRKKLVSVQREIISLSERVEQWGLLPNDPLVTRPPNPRELILQRNIKQMAVGSLQTVVAVMPELPTEERYAELRVAYQERLARRREIEREQMAQNARSFPNSNASSRDRDKHSASPNGRRGRTTLLKPSASLDVLSKVADEGWVSNSPFQLNPFKEDEVTGGGEELNAIQQQYLNIKSYLQQAAQAGRLEEVEILEKNLMEMEQELKRLQLPTPRLID